MNEPMIRDNSSKSVYTSQTSDGVYWTQKFGQGKGQKEDILKHDEKTVSIGLTSAKVVQELLKEEKTLAQIASEYEVHPTP
jgi:hypothetical protein